MNTNVTKGEKDIFNKIFIQFYNILDTNIFAGYFQNYSGFENRKIALLSKQGIVKIFSNYLTWKREKGPGFMNPPGGPAKFYRWNNNLYFLEMFCDTLCQVTKDRLIPRYYFDTGHYKAEYSKQNEIVSDWYKYFLISDIKENDNHIFITFSFDKKDYLGIVDKKSSALTICNIGKGVSTLTDDVCGLMGVYPDHFTKNNEMVYVIQPTKLMSWFKENPKKAAEARMKLAWLKNIDEFSNPIIAIGKCKE